MRPPADWALYLVTDSTEAVLGGRDLVAVVRSALEGGVSAVQYRDKTSDSAVLVATARQLHAACRQHGVPLIVNDRVDVALAVGCEGVHLGQDDLDIAAARQILGHGKIVGATVSSVDEARTAVRCGADYLGIGTLYPTATKKNTKHVIGINGTRRILRFLGQGTEEERRVKTVCIGGVNASNLQLIKHQLYAPSGPSEPKTIDGVAVASAIMGAANPREAAGSLKRLWGARPPFAPSANSAFRLTMFGLEKDEDEAAAIRESTLKAVKAVDGKSPLAHNMTNLVVQNFAASVALSIGASPIMSNNGLEAPDLSKLGGGLVINMGTAAPDSLSDHRLAIQAYNSVGGPVVLDPVGAGATSARKEALSFLMASGYFDLIKGNEREIMAVARASGFTLDDSSQQKGVDSRDSLFSVGQRAYIVSRIASRERNVVLMTGAIDVISDGIRTYSIENGHMYLGMITGSGCTLGTTISAYLAAYPQDKLEAAIGGILHYEIAAEEAAKREDVKGPGTFIPAFVDELYRLRMEIVEGKGDWVEKRMKVKSIKEIPDAGLLREL